MNEINERKVIDFLESVNTIKSKYEVSSIRKTVDSLLDNEINIFELISSVYHRENFHSDIIAYLLNPKFDSIDFNNYFKYFIEIINCKENLIDISNYTDIIVVREEDRIDIKIKDIKSGHTIIIENKINNAVDMDKQLIRYHDAVGDKLDCIIYLSLDGYKKPSYSNWTVAEIEKIESKLILFGAVTNEEFNLCEWLEKSKSFTVSEKNKIIINDYIELLKKLRNNMVNLNELKEFKELITDSGNYNIALKIKELINNLPYILADEIVKDFKTENIKAPFKKVALAYNGSVFVLDEWMYKDSKYCITIDSNEYNYTLRFFDKNNPTVNNTNIISIIIKYGFELQEDSEYRKLFKVFIDEKMMMDTLKKMFEEFIVLESI